MYHTEPISSDPNATMEFPTVTPHRYYYNYYYYY